MTHEERKVIEQAMNALVYCQVAGMTFANVGDAVSALRSLLDKPADFVRQCKAGEIEHTVEFTSAIEVPVEEVREMVARLRDKQNMDDLEDDAANFIERLAGIKS